MSRALARVPRQPAPAPRALPAAYPALRELAGSEPAARRALCRGLLRGSRLGLRDGPLLLFAFAALERWRSARTAPQPA